ncbi:MAG: hypothetical protein ACRECM_12245 [Methyloceanibacter sp.]
MQTLSPSIDRIGAALKALRQTHAHDAKSADKISLGAKCLHVIVAQLTEEGVPQEDLQPLVDLEAALGEVKAQAQAEGVANRRKRRPPSDVFLARASAVIDLLIKGGNDESEAAQIVMRRLVAAGVPPPEKGGDARGWRRLLEWRSGLIQGVGSKEAQLEYQDFTREIDAIPANERVRRVLDEQLWDRRRKPR